MTEQQPVDKIYYNKLLSIMKMNKPNTFSTCGDSILTLCHLCDKKGPFLQRCGVYAFHSQGETLSGTKWLKLLLMPHMVNFKVTFHSFRSKSQILT